MHAQDYIQHMRSQWADRQLYWNARSLSRRYASNPRTMGDSSLLAVMLDGMDQAKFKLPHQRRSKVKAMDRFVRPSTHVGGVWAHGYAYHLHATLPDVPKDPVLNIESLAKILDATLAIAGRLPHHLWMQQDNASNMCKNITMFRFGIRLVLDGLHKPQLAAAKLTTCGPDIRRCISALISCWIEIECASILGHIDCCRS